MSDEVFGTIRGLIEINKELIEIEECLETYGDGIKGLLSDINDLREKVATLEEEAKEKEKEPVRYFRGDRFLWQGNGWMEGEEEFIVVSYDSNLFLASLMNGNYWANWVPMDGTVQGEPYTLDATRLFNGKRDEFRTLKKSELT